MMKKPPLCPERIRKITGSFAFIEHRFLRHGFFANLSHHELVLYVFLVLVADRNGLSYYSFDRICALLNLSTDAYIAARNALIQKDLIAFDGFFFQVLSLPDPPAWTRAPPRPQADPDTIRRLIRQSVGDNHDQSTHHL
ncbi:MAG: helix-turn-helix domain-containing protein [Planctomycetota bacterium]|jgi:hypothetical protein